MQDTWLVGEQGAEPLSQLPVQVFDGSKPA
jgi:hypothetical protein